MQAVLDTARIDRWRASIGLQAARLMSVPSEIAIRTAEFAFAERDAARNEARALARVSRRATLAIADQAIVDDLEREGVHVTTLEALGLDGTQAMLDAAGGLRRELADRRPRLARAGANSVVASGSELMGLRPIVDWGVHERLLDIVEAYLGDDAAYDCPLVYLSVANGVDRGIRAWHRDREDSRTLKVAIYLNDVDEDGGPFQVLTPELQALVDRRASWRYAKLNNAKSATRIRESDWATGVRSITGPAGLVIFADTARRHHRGAPPVARDRAAIFHSYFSRAPSHPYCCERSTLNRRQIRALAATLSPRQQEALLWRDGLSWLQRLIPRNRLSI